MKLTAKGRYAVMAVADIANQPVGVPVNLTEISERQGISLTYLEQIFGKLRKAGLVESTRGPGGGYSLLGPAKDVSLGQIIRAVNEDIRAHGCTPQTRLSCTGKSDKCLTHSLWGALEDHIAQFLSSVTVQDVVEKRFPLPDTLPGTLPDMEAAQ